MGIKASLVPRPCHGNEATVKPCSAISISLRPMGWSLMFLMQKSRKPFELACLFSLGLTSSSSSDENDPEYSPEGRPRPLTHQTTEWCSVAFQSLLSPPAHPAHPDSWPMIAHYLILAHLQPLKKLNPLLITAICARNVFPFLTLN